MTIDAELPGIFLRRHAYAARINAPRHHPQPSYDTALALPEVTCMGDFSHRWRSLHARYGSSHPDIVSVFMGHAQQLTAVRQTKNVLYSTPFRPRPDTTSGPH